MRIPFDTSQGQLPVAPAGMRLQTITFATCPGSDLRLECAAHEGAGGERAGAPARVDEFGMATVSWWRIVSERLSATRAMRLTQGATSMRSLLRRYGFMDASGCVNHRDAHANYAPLDAAFPMPALAVDARLRNATGVPQFYYNSGNCWYGALCTVSFGNPAVLALLQRKMDAEMASLAGRALHDRVAAERLRERLWREYRVGDDVDDSPLKDGRNGFSEFTVLCAKLGVPLVRYRNEGRHTRLMPCNVNDRRGKRCTVPTPQREDPHLLAVRFQDGDHVRYPVLRCLTMCGTRYELVGWYAGQRKCGHQIGVAFPCLHDWRQAIIGDSDLHKDGIGVVHVNYFGEPCKWWDAWRSIVHVTKFGPNASFCNLSPHNPPENSLDIYRRPEAQTPGWCSLDLVYLSQPCA